MKTKTSDLLVQSKASALISVYMFCCQYDLRLTISKESMEIILPCGGEISANFDPVGCEYEATKLINKQFRKVKELMRELKEKDIKAGVVKSCFDEENLYNDYLKGIV